MSKVKTIIQKLKFLVLFLVFAFVIWNLAFGISARAQDCGADLDCQISQIQREINALSPAHERNKAELASLRAQLSDLNRKIAGVSNRLTTIEKNIQTREEDMAYVREVFDQKAQSHYKFIRLYDPILPFLSSSDATQAFREISFRQKAEDEDRKTMDKYSQDLLKLKNDKEDLEKYKISLASIKSQISDKEKFLAGEVAKVESYISTLTAKQNELIAQKEGGFQTSVGDVPPTQEPCSGPPGSSSFCDPGTRPAFGAFSFGAPHRTGLSQYGAYGRAKSGQSAESILSAYYNGAEIKKDYSSPATIGVSGYGRIPFEENYLLGIYEVPESWGDSGGFEALKAQAVAARSYALYATGGGSGTICPDESCQVYKPALKSGKWKDAVVATRSWVLMKGGSAAPAYYAASSGGFTISQWGWNGIKDASGAWPDTAYEKVGGSPWFYKGWFKSRSGASCDRGGPWLTSTEMADIINAWRALYQGLGDSSRVSPIGPCWGGSPYSISELQSLGGYSSVSGVSVIYGNDGSTLSVTFSTNSGAVSIPGDQFKKAFNLRATGYIGLKSSLFNIEKL